MTESTGALALREVRAADWPEILALANASVAHVAGAGTQEEWYRNRRAFPAGGSQHHFVCVEGDRLVGYGAAERRASEPEDSYHLFVVTLPEHLATAGARIVRELDTILSRRGARRSWLREHADNAEFLGFLERQGYRMSRRFDVDGIPLALLEKEHASSAGRRDPAQDGSADG